MSKVLRLQNDSNRSICWRRLNQNDHKVVDRFVNIFCKTEPTLLGMKFSEEETRFTVDHALKLLPTQQSICAYDQESNDVLGMTIISGPMKVRESKPIDLEQEPTLKQRQLMRAFEELWKSFPEEAKDELCQKGEILVVDPQNRGLGIASALVQKSLDLAKEQGCKLFLADCTSAFSAKLRENLGAVCLSQINHADYVDPLTGERILTNVAPPHKAFKLMCHHL